MTLHIDPRTVMLVGFPAALIAMGFVLRSIKFVANKNSDSPHPENIPKILVSILCMLVSVFLLYCNISMYSSLIDKHFWTKSEPKVKTVEQIVDEILASGGDPR